MDKTEFFKPIVNAVKLIDDAKKTPLPEWDISDLQSSQMANSDDPDMLWQAFSDRFKLVHGRTIEGIETLLPMMQIESLKEGYIDPSLDKQFATPLNHAGIATHSSIDPYQIDKYQFGITRAAGAIAETGSIILKEKSTSSRLGALSPWVHIAVLERDAPIYRTLLDAMEDLGDDPYIVLVTGPSKTADVEGILIEGVHGPGMQICCRT